MKKLEKSQKVIDLTSSKEFKELSSLIAKLTKKYGFSGSEIIEFVEKRSGVPITVFNKNLSPLVCVVKYMHEDLELSYKYIGTLLNRSPKTIWQAYNFGLKKFPSRFEIKPSPYYIPFSVLSNRVFSILESVVKYLVENYDLKLSMIADLIYRDDRTIWTVYNRAKKKVKHES